MMRRQLRRFFPDGWTQRSRPLLVGTLLAALALAGGRSAVAQAPPDVSLLTADDVTAIVAAAARALSDDTLAVAVVDRAGTVLGVYRRTDTPAIAPDVAVSLARTTAFFSNNQAPLSSRTVRFISGIHFPAGVPNTPPAPLYGVENINRGCDLGPFNVPIDRPESIAGTFGPRPGIAPLPCRPGATSGCSVGITTGKPNLLDYPSRFGATGGGVEDVNPGGIPLYRDGKLIGGVGVAGVPAQRAQYAALVAAAGNGRGVTTAIAFPDALPTPGAIFIDGLRLPFYGDCGTNLDCVQRAADTRPSGTSPGTVSQGFFVVQPRDGRPAWEGYLIGPRGSPAGGAGSLTREEVVQIVDQAVAAADTIRAQVRLPYGQTAKFIIAVTDQDGEVLAEFRMPDALFDAVDVVPSKARNAYYFSTREGYEVLRGYVDGSPEGYRWEPEPPGAEGWALTNRTIGFGGQPLFPPGIDQVDRVRETKRGPWFELFVYDTENPCTEGPVRGADAGFLNQNGITWFPGSAPLYKNGRLVGGIGVSGDGIDQNDFVTAAGAAGFEPPDELRVDNSVIVVPGGDEVRLPYLKFPRNPTQR